MKMPASELVVETDILYVSNSSKRESLINSAIKNSKYSCHVVNDIYSALNTAIVSNPRIVVLSEEVDEMDLIRHCIRFSEEKLVNDIPIIVLVNCMQPKLSESLLNAGATSVLLSDVSPKELFACLIPYLEMQKLKTDYESLQENYNTNLLRHNKLEKDFMLHQPLVESMIEGITLVTMDEGKIIYSNAVFEKMFQYDKASLVGKPISIIAAKNYDAKDKFREIGESLKLNNCWEGEMMKRRKDGEEFWCKVSISAFKYPELGNVWLSVFEDISKRKKSEEVFRKIEAENSAIINAFPHLLFRINDKGVYLDYRASDKKLLFTDPSNFLGKSVTEVMPPGLAAMIMDGIAKALATRQASIFVYSLNINERDSFFEAKILPVTTNELLVFVSDITSRKLEEAEHNARIRQIQTISDNLPDTIIYKLIVDKNGGTKFGYISRGIQDVLRLDAKEVIDHPELLYNLVVEEDRLELTRRREEAIRDMKFMELECKMVLSNGQEKIVNMRSMPFKVSEDTYVFDGMIIDVTQKKTVENQLRESEENYRTLTNQSSDGIIIYSFDGTIHDFNEPVLKLAGYSREEFVKLNARDLLVEHKMILAPGNEDKIKANESFLFTRKAIKKDGSIIDLEINARLLKDGRVLANLRDITDRNKSEEMIRASEERFELVTKTTKNGIWDWDIVNSKWYMSSRWYEIMGFEINSTNIPGNIEEWSERIHKDHLDIVRKALSSHLEKNIPYDVEYLYLNNHGKYKWHKSVAQAIFDADGKPVRMVGSLSDIHESKMAELALKKSLKEVSDYKYALDQAANISITDCEGTITYVNDKFCKQYGYTPEEIIGQNHRIINSNYYPKLFWKNFWKTIMTGKVMKAEVCNVGKDGKYHWGDTSIVPFMDESGKPFQFLAIRTDITEKRKLEKELSLQQLNQQKLITEVTIQEQEKERNELGRELHDNINQILASAKLYLGMVKSNEDPTGILLEQSFAFLNEAIEEIRNLSHSLVAPSLGELDLREALQSLVTEANKTKGFEMLLVYDIPSPDFIDSKEQLMLYRIVQEQMNNIRKYAKATKGIIQIAIKNRSLYISVTDNGVGFDTNKKSKGIGLRNIQSRVSFYSGFFNIISAPGQGCVLEASIPLNELQLGLLDTKTW
ncbi:MAG: PAS domain S-box protein [Chitinophagaceae bacterium]|nr:PAS domain S-box protein [Chitinophagaceae bacterium]